MKKSNKVLMALCCAISILTAFFSGCYLANEQDNPFDPENLPPAFAKTYEGTSGDSGYGLCQTPDGGYIIAGGTSSFGTDGDVWVIKLDKKGTIQWQKSLDSGQDEMARSVHMTRDGGFIIGGNRGNEDTLYQAWVVKLDAEGSVEWNRSFGTVGGNMYDTIKDVIQTSDGGYMFIGSTNDGSFEFNSSDIWIGKLDTDGHLQWQYRYGHQDSNMDDVGHSVIETTDGGYIVAGETKAYDVDGTDAWIMKMTAAGSIALGGGTPLPRKAFGGTGNDTVNSLIATDDGGIICAGRTNSFGAGGYDAWVIKLDINLSIEWQKTYGTAAGNESASSIKACLDGGYMFTGTTTAGHGGDDIWVVKLDSAGSIQWQKAFGNANHDEAQTGIQTADGWFAVAGSTFYGDSDTTHNNVWLLRLDVDGDAGSMAINTNALSSSPGSVTITTPASGNDTDRNPLSSGMGEYDPVCTVGTTSAVTGIQYP
ncbi:MAG: hypothetical protein CVV44_14250 [Spirochaetae bacterium HGW-Spirochaetae-1]|jgi:hypothetical protein|nr:MAG: hypothetical protein CVV44_14250 [Spirochaetae bacterium HGW-Spirochaetae-1]